MHPDLTTGRSPASWKAIVDQMIGLGAVATADEAGKIAHYLSHTYPVRK